MPPKVIQRKGRCSPADQAQADLQPPGPVPGRPQRPARPLSGKLARLEEMLDEVAGRRTTAP